MYNMGKLINNNNKKNPSMGATSFTPHELIG